MPVPDFILDLRAKVGHSMLWLSGATAVILREGAEGAEVLLVRRSDDGNWSPVCGIVDPGEDPHLTAIREAAEEACVEIAVERLAWLNVTEPVVYDNGDVTQYIDHTFRCRWLAGEPRPGDGEATEAGFFSVTNLPADMPSHYRDRIEVASAERPDTVFGPLGDAFDKGAAMTETPDEARDEVVGQEVLSQDREPDDLHTDDLPGTDEATLDRLDEPT